MCECDAPMVSAFWKPAGGGAVMRSPQCPQHIPFVSCLALMCTGAAGRGVPR
jgi:hypothetical protein